MPHLVRPVTDERDALLAFLGQQRKALRNSVHALTDEQAAQQTCASSLSLGVLIKHAARVERRWTVVMIAQRELPELWPITDPEADFRLEDGETASNLLPMYAEVAAETESIVDGVSDLGALLPGIPDYPISTEWSARWVLLHLIEETARHAGHADLLREALDDASASELLNSVEREAAT